LVDDASACLPEKPSILIMKIIFWKLIIFYSSRQPAS